MAGCRRLAGAAVMAAFLVLAPAVPAHAQDAAQSLDEAIRLFEDGRFIEAQEMLASVDRAALSSEQQKIRDDYLGRVQVAVTMYEKALRDLEDAETAIEDHDYARAEELLERVLDNEYAAEPLRQSARAHLSEIGERSEVLDAGESAPAERGAEPPVAQPTASSATGQPSAEAQSPAPTIEPIRPAGTEAERARALTREAADMVRAGRYDEARRRYEEALRFVPGYPEAVDGLADLQAHESNVAGERGLSLAERIRRRDAINWQRTEAQYREAERVVRGHVADEQFAEANQMLARAAQIVEAGKQFADPVSVYEALKADADVLARFVREQERGFHERKVEQTRREIEQQRSQRLQQVEEERARQVGVLMEEALEHRKNGELDAALNVLRQVVVIDPKHAPARWMIDMLEDQRQFRNARETRRTFYEVSRGALEDVEVAKIPWFDELRYPKDWAELIARPERSQPGQSHRDRLLIGALDRPVRVDFDRTPFEEAVERLATSHKLNVIVNWHDLTRAGVDPSAPIRLDLPQEISLRKALTEVLEQAGAGKVELGFEVDDGALTVASRAYLAAKTYPKVYDISDLLVEVPSFTEAPAMDLRKLDYHRPPVSESADLPWRVGDDDDDEPEHDPERASRVRKLIDLIQETVDPDSWRDRGGSIGTIKEINSQLVVTQNSAGHQRIAGLLNKLREERAMQVSVEALFITVSSHYLEEMGLDLDIVFNSGSAGFDFLDGGLGPVTDPVLGNRLLLPRSFSRLGFTPNTPALGTVIPTGNVTVLQPYGTPFLVPEVSGGSGSRGTPVPMASSVLDFTNPVNISSDVPGSFGGQNVGPALSIFGSFLDNIQVDFLIRATQADSRSSVLTAPRLVVFNGGSAWIAVTIQQNFVSQLQPFVAQGAVAQAPITQPIDAGASLFVRATVTADKRYVMMLLAPGVTRLLDIQTFQFSGGTGAGQAFVQLPTLSAQRIQTMVSVPDGGTLLLGGQKLASETEVESGVPILSKIPILKRVYSARTSVKDEQTLLILIKPKILIQAEQEQLAFPSFSQR